MDKSRLPAGVKEGEVEGLLETENSENRKTAINFVQNPKTKNRNKSPHCLSFGKLQNFLSVINNFYTCRLVLLSEVLSVYSIVSTELIEVSVKICLLF